MFQPRKGVLDQMSVAMGDSGTYCSLYFIERIEVLKGPSPVFYSRSLPNDLVVMTSKKPETRLGCLVPGSSGLWYEPLVRYAGHVSTIQRACCMAVLTLS